jgi:hypothetical protein
VGTSFQIILATGEEAGVREAIAASGQQADVVAIGELRWAVIPAADDGYAETDDLARLASRTEGAVAASVQVFDSDVLTPFDGSPRG